ncbi:branched-chain amino acid transporter permease [Alkalilimnicola ehrlichii]|uniref:branched-chain amino acid transporter permease n=1 Tax=Alkalilimnicola ehrlichii TaxID=351052 RepID=UPI000E2F2AAC|nr:AzlD domain-containing protein [Alkalilimnicola ehrlichii]
MSDSLYLLAAIGIMALATIATRALPFVLLRDSQHPLVFYLGRYLPPAVMALLVIYSLRHLPGLAWLEIGAYMLAIALTAGLHVWRRNALLSIATGTGVFMLLQQTVLL